MQINAKVVDLISLWALHLGVGFDDPCGPLPTLSILLFCENL